MKIVAVTSCATGIAHSYMAAEAIRKIAKRNNHEVKVEIQGAMGIEDKLSERDISEADVVFFANDVGITQVERFNGVQDRIVQLNPNIVIRNPETILKYLEKAQ
jgi:PTS system, fructose-specific, IIB component